MSNRIKTIPKCENQGVTLYDRMRWFNFETIEKESIPFNGTIIAMFNCIRMVLLSTIQFIIKKRIYLADKMTTMTTTANQLTMFVWNMGSIEELVIHSFLVALAHLLLAVRLFRKFGFDQWPDSWYRLVHFSVVFVQYFRLNVVADRMSRCHSMTIVVNQLEHRQISAVAKGMEMEMRVDYKRSDSPKILELMKHKYESLHERDEQTKLSLVSLHILVVAV